MLLQRALFKESPSVTVHKVRKRRGDINVDQLSNPVLVDIRSRRLQRTQSDRHRCTTTSQQISPVQLTSECSRSSRAVVCFQGTSSAPASAVAPRHLHIVPPPGYSALDPVTSTFSGLFAVKISRTSRAQREQQRQKRGRQPERDRRHVRERQHPAAVAPLHARAVASGAHGSGSDKSIDRLRLFKIDGSVVWHCVFTVFLRHGSVELSRDTRHLHIACVLQASKRVAGATYREDDHRVRGRGLESAAGAGARAAVPAAGRVVNILLRFGRVLESYMEVMGIEKTQEVAQWREQLNSERQERVLLFQQILGDELRLLEAMGDAKQQMELLTLLKHDVTTYWDILTPEELDVMSDVYNAVTRHSGIVLVGDPPS
ncbi:hypothetical protein ON010_g7685 [Phytophthora cinnamomi]|nr:hypothetical protein ON010_g7685 [Phytophthora cinnamomi]